MWSLASLLWAETVVFSEWASFFTQCLLYLMLTTLIASRRDTNVAVLGHTVGGAVLAFLIIQRMGEFLWRRHILALLGDLDQGINLSARIVGLSVVLLLFVYLAGIRRRRTVAMFYGAVFLFGYALLVSLSRSAWLATAAGILTSFILLWRSKERGVSPLRVNVPILLRMVVVWWVITATYNPSAIAKIVDRAISAVSQISGPDERFGIWRAALNLAAESPLIGHGFGRAQPLLGQLSHRLEDVRSLGRLLLGAVPDADRRAYRDFQQRLFDYVASHSQDQDPIVVDSSKSSRRAVGRMLALRRVAGLDVYALHLVRNGWASMESLLVTGSNWSLEGHGESRRWPALRAALGWVSANVWASALGQGLGPGRYLRLRLEDLVPDPGRVLRLVGEFCGFDPEAVVARIGTDEPFTVGHLVGGNRVRLQKQIRLRAEHHQSGGERLRPYQRLVFSATGGWLNRRYGYDGASHPPFPRGPIQSA